MSLKECDVNVRNKDGDTPLHTAAELGQYETIVQLLSYKECNPNIQNSEGDTPLHSAVRQGKTAVVSRLLTYQQCDPNVQNKDGDTPLHTAVKNNTSYTKHRTPAVHAISHLLTNKRCNPNVPNKDGDTPLHIAIRHCQEDTVFLMSLKECDVNVQNKDGDTPLHIACYRKSFDTVKFLLKRKCSTNILNKKGKTAQDILLNKDGDCLLHIACQWGDVDIVMYLITDERFNPSVRSSTSGNTPLHIACYRKSLDIIKLLLEWKCNTSIPNKKGETAQDIPLNEDGDSLLHIACQWCNVDIVRYLVTDERFNPSVQSSISENTPLHIAAKYGQDKTIVQLLSYKECNLNIQNSEGDTPLHSAIRQGKTAVVSCLLTYQQCDPNVQNKDGDTPLHTAVKNNTSYTTHRTPAVHAISHLLTNKRCNPNVLNKKGDTPLHIACYRNLFDIVKLLLKWKCDTNIPNKKGKTAQDIPLNEDGDRLLHIACQWGDADIVRYLIIGERCNPSVQSFISENTPLHIAAKYGQDDTTVQLLSCKECNPNAHNKKGDTPLHLAIKQKETAVVSQLLANKQCNPNVQNKDGDTPLHIAFGYDSTTAISQLLFHKQCDPTVQNKEGDTPLHIAVKFGQDEIIVQLLSYKQCDPNVQNKDGDTPLHTAVWYYSTTAISQLLLHKQCDPNVQNKKGDTPLHIAAEHWQEGAVFLMSIAKCDVNVQNKEGDTPLHIACYRKSLDIIKLLLEWKCDTNIPNKRGDTAQDIPLNEDGDRLLHIACQWGDVDIVRYLITDERFNPSVQSSISENTPLHIAAKYGQDKTIVQLLSYGECNPNIQNSEGDTPLHSAIRQGKTAVLSRLLTYQQCDPNVQNKDGDTPLHIAVKNNTSYTKHRTPAVHAISHLLTNKRCNPNVPNKKGDTPLHIACFRNLFDIVKLLLKWKCDTNIPNKKGKTAQDIPLNKDGDCLLHIACQWGDVDIVRYLITNERCNPSVQSSTSENTPLHIACYMKSLDIIKLLLEWKCNTNIPNKDGETAQDIILNEDGDSLLHIACQWGDVDIVRYLITIERCNPNILNSHLNTPMHIACYKKFLSIIRLLIENRCCTDIPNKRGDTAQNIPLNEDGDRLLHIACQWGDADIVRYLITDENCDVNVQNTYQNTPLHTAIYTKSLSTIKLLLERRCSTNIPNKKGESTQDIPLNEDGDSLLHIACQWGDVNIVRYLVTDEQCSLRVQNANLQTPLHVACYQNSLSIIKIFLEMRCSTNIPNTKGETAQDIPLNEDGDRLLHIACQWGDVDIIRYLITDENCDVNIQNMCKNTPLHTAAKHCQNDSVTQLLSCVKCDPNIQNTNGDTPLHTAVEHCQNDSITQLLSCAKCDPNIQNTNGDTPLHTAVEHCQNDSITQLLSCAKCDPNIQNTNGDTPLHTAVEHCQNDSITQLLSCAKCDPNIQNTNGDTPLHIDVRDNITPVISPLHVTTVNRTPVVSLLLTSGKCNPNIVNKDHLTPLLIAIKHSNPAVATALLQHHKCDCTLCDQHGNTSLHLACIGGETQPEMVEVAKQLLTSVNPSCVNNAGQTPIELTTNYQLIQAISSFVKCKTKHSVQTYINIFIVGNPETGKSTLVKAICKEATGILWKIIPKQLRRVRNVPLHTAGIIPTTFRSKTFGNTVLYDLAGQVEYYTSHAAVIQSTVISTPPAFIVVVNLSESEEKISRTLRYWWSFIDNHAARSSAPPQVILVGSYADIVNSTGRSAQEKLTQMSALLKQMSTSFHFAGQVQLDCRDPASRKLQHLCFLVNQSCSVLRQTADVDLRCHMLYAFLLERFKGKVACTVEDVAVSVRENRELLPENSAHLIPLISTLSDKGLLFLVKGGERYADWWIILQKQALLGEMNGMIFAPKSFRQHKDLSWSTGVVPFSELKKEFSDYNPKMVSEFLVHLEFCFKIEDHETLALLKDEAEDTSPDVSEEYYFFPALVSVENPLHVWEQDGAMVCKCGWYYQCIRHDQFLATHFLHVLILRLAFTFALKLDPGDCREGSLAIRRKCSVWKHGIAWLNGASIETVVEVGLQYQSVIVMMHCPTGKEAKCVELRSEVIQKVLQVKDEHCKAVKMSESFIHPTDVNYPFTQDDFDDVKFYSFTGIARTIIKGEENALDQRGRHPIPVQDLLLFDPDTNTELLTELFSEKHSMDETVRSQALKALNSKVEKCKFSVPHMPHA